MASLSGCFLVAKSTLKDTNFAQTVVLLLEHSHEGAYGVIINRPVPVKAVPFPLYDGGPCESPGLLLLHGHEEWLDPPEKKDEAEIAPGVFLGTVKAWKRASEDPDADDLRLRVFRGYAGWGPGQLEGELVAGAWLLLPATRKLIFDEPAEELWDRLTPPDLPQPSLN